MTFKGLENKIQRYNNILKELKKLPKVDSFAPETLTIYGMGELSRNETNCKGIPIFTIGTKDDNLIYTMERVPFLFDKPDTIKTISVNDIMFYKTHSIFKYEDE